MALLTRAGTLLQPEGPLAQTAPGDTQGGSPPERPGCDENTRPGAGDGRQCRGREPEAGHVERPCAASRPRGDTGPAAGWSLLAPDDGRERLSPARRQGPRAGSWEAAAAEAATPQTPPAHATHRGALFPTELPYGPLGTALDPREER